MMASHYEPRRRRWQANWPLTRGWIMMAGAAVLDA